MSTPILATKLYIPPLRSKAVLRPGLIERLNEGLSSGRKLTLISASAGFGKTTLVSEWVNHLRVYSAKESKIVNPKSKIVNQVAWLSLDEGDNDSTQFLTYLVAALQMIRLNIGDGVLGMLQSPQPPPIESMLTILLNEIAAIPDNFIFVLDDYHILDSKPVDNALTFLLEHLPPQMHLVITTREDPQLPLARLRARGQLTELRAADLRFTPAEAAEFLNQAMSLQLSAEDIAALDTRTEGWITGLQLAALSMQGHQDTTRFIQSFTGSHRFVLDYLIEEVLQQQSERVQTFLLHTSILDRLCGPLCDAVLLAPSRFASGQETLEYLEHTNLFVVPLDNERRWYRYHHLFGELLRQRLHQSASSGNEEEGVGEYHIRASQWYEDNGLDIEAFHYAAAANDIERAERLIEGKGMPLQFRGALTPVLNWLASLPTTVLDARPSLWVMYASTLSMTGQLTGVEPKLQAAEAALQGAELDYKTRDLIGQIAAIRALLAALQNQQVEVIISQSHRALEYLHPDNLAARTATIWFLGTAYHLQGDRAAAGRAYTEAIAISQVSGNLIINLNAMTGLGKIQEMGNQLYQAAETYRQTIQLVGDSTMPAGCEAHLGLARILYEWNDLDAAEQHGQQSLHLAQQIENTNRAVSCEVFLARLKLARGDVTGAAAMLAQTDKAVHQHNFVNRIPEVAAAQVQVLLRQGDLAAAAHLAHTHQLPLSQAQVHLAQGDASTALMVLEPLRQQIEAKGWVDEQLKIMVLQTVAFHAYGEKDKAAHLLGDALALAEPGGFIRIFVDEGEPMRLLIEKQSRSQDHKLIGYVDRLLTAFARPAAISQSKTLAPERSAGASAGVGNLKSTMIEPLSQRELEVLQLIAHGLSNREISERLFLALSTVKGHSRIIFDKLQVQRRTEAVARARELGLL